jgi:hypothetical protein
MVDWCPDGWILIVILPLCVSASGRESTSSGRLNQSSLIWTWKKNLKLIDHWRSSGRDAETSERMQAGTEASRCRWVSGRKSTSYGRMMLWSVGRPNGMTRRLDGWNCGPMSVRTGWHVVRTTCRELKYLTCKIVQNHLKHFWIVDSLWNASLHTSDFVQSEWGQSQKVTNSPFGHYGTKITWPVWKNIPGPRIKITPPFCHKGAKGKTV